MEKSEFLDAIEKFGQSLSDYAQKAKKDLDSVEETDLNELSEKVMKPILLIDYKSLFTSFKKKCGVGKNRL
ncbi:MAG: hypothetical protein U9N62_12745 [Thermotogota bacterium]|nr:hypothetical protein [Thermotogota bacterium]